MEKFNENPEDSKEKLIAKAKNSFGKDLRRAAMVMGLGALSMLPQEKQKNVNVENFPKDFEKNKTEWMRKDMESDPEIISEILLAERQKYISDKIALANEAITDFSTEYEHRKKTGQPTEDFKNIKTDTLLLALREARDDMERYERNKSPVKFLADKEYPAKVLEKKEEIKKMLILYDRGREWLLKNISKPEYHKRLASEIGKAEFIPKSFLDEIAKDYQSGRINKAKDNDYILSIDVGGSYSHLEAFGKKLPPGPVPEVGAFYNMKENKVFFPLKADSLDAVELTIHEYAHKVTEGIKNIPLTTIKTLNEAFDSLSVAINLSGIASEDILQNISYFSDPSEIYARKKVFDYDLERLGIKKYEEKFTMKHYLKTLKLQKEGKLTQNSNEFLFLIKPKMIFKIMNEVAINEPIETNKKETNV